MRKISKNIRRSESPQERFRNLFSRGSILVLRFLTCHMILYKFSYDFDFYFGFEALNSIGYGGDDRFYAFWDSRLCKLHFFCHVVYFRTGVSYIFAVDFKDYSRV